MQISSNIYQKLAYLTQAHNIASSNIANTNTPGYLARSLAPFAFMDHMKCFNLKRTSNNHIDGEGFSNINQYSVVVNKAIGDSKLNGNNVDSKAEASKLLTIEIEYQQWILTYHANKRIYNEVIKSGE